VLIELDGTDPANPWTCGPGSFLDAMLTLAGGANASTVVNAPWGQISTAQLTAVNPDIIILADWLYGATPEGVAARPGWGGIRAVQNGAIYLVDDSLLSRPGPGLLDGLEFLAQLLHPELFP
jgi:iron complex transport system substrate-binding protein